MGDPEVTAPIPDGDKINLGCGMRWAPGWKNLDGGPAARLMWLRKLRLLDWVLPKTTLSYPRDLIVADLRRTPLPFPDGSASIVFSSYCLEYLTPQESDRLLADCCRILRPGGLIRLIQTDVDPIVECYRREKPSQPCQAAVDNVGRFLAHASPQHTEWRIRFFRRGGVQQLFDKPSIEYGLTKAGFAQVTFCKDNGGACPDLDRISFISGRWKTLMLHVEARKPA